MLESNRKKLQDFLDAQKTQSERNSLGQFSTPYCLAIDIMKYVKNNLDTRPISFLEPAIGTGVFYSAFLDVFGSDIPHKALGFEIDSHYFCPSKKFWANSQLEMRNADFLYQCPEKQFSLLVTNPPYCRHHHIDPEKKKVLQRLVLQYTGIKISGLAGLYCYFLMLSTRWLKEDALSCWLIPSEFMDVNFGEAVKYYLLNNVDLVQIHSFSPDKLQFNDALITSSIVVFRNRKPTQHEIIFSRDGSILEPVVEKSFSRFSLSSKTKWSSLISNKITDEPQSKIGDFFQAKRGIATGNNGFFIVDENTVKQYQIPKAFLTPILPGPRLLKKNRIESVDGVPSLEKKFFLFSCNLPENEIKQSFPFLWTYIQNGNEKGIPTGYICSRRTPWYNCEKSEPAPFVMPYMGRSDVGQKLFRFILNNSNAIATNGYLLLYPKPQYASCLQDHDVLIKVWETLNAIPIELLVKSGRVYGGGLYKIEPRELMQVPVASLEKILGSKYIQQEFSF